MHEREIHRRKLEIEAWVEARLALDQPLFAHVLAPPCGTPYLVLGGLVDQGQTDFNTPELNELFRLACQYVVRARREHLGVSALPESRGPSGRWLLYYPNYVEFSQLAHEPGLVDEADAPAWDLWVCWRPGATSGVLVSWVPSELVGRYDLATQLSPAGALVWADDPAVVFARGPGYIAALLRKDGLTGAAGSPPHRLAV